MSFTNHHLCDGSDNREVEYEDMTKEQRDIINAKFTELAASLLALRSAMSELLDADSPSMNDYIQHVGYDEEQCGRTK